jgi:RNA polymerase sigma-70 factor, ECF subfamily
VNSSQFDLSVSASINQESTAREEELLLAARSGSHAAFGELQRTYSHRIYKTIYSIIRNREDAEDALQDTFLCAYRALPCFEGRCKFSSWLTKIAMNSALMTIRKRRARPEASFEQQPNAEEDSVYFDVRDSAPNPEEICDQKQRSQAILLAIQQLNPKLRTSMGIWISQERSMKDLASHLGISLASVKARLHRARKHLTRSPIFRNHRTEPSSTVPARRERRPSEPRTARPRRERVPMTSSLEPEQHAA